MKLFLADKLFKNALDRITLGELNNRAVARVLNVPHNTLATQLSGDSRWFADYWILYMLVIGAAEYKRGYLSIVVKVPEEWKERLQEIVKHNKKTFFCIKKLKKK